MKKLLAVVPLLFLAVTVSVLYGCDTYDAPTTSVQDKDDAKPAARSAGKIVGQEIDEGTALANGYRVDLKTPLRSDAVYTDDSRVKRPDFTWVVTANGAVADMTQFSVQIPSVCSDPAATPPPAEANPTPTPSNGVNFNNSVPDALGELVIEWHINNSDKDTPREFRLDFDTDYRVGWVKAAVQTTSNNVAWAWVLGPCSNVFDTSGYVWLDLDGEGDIDEPEEPGISGVTVTLLEDGTDAARIGSYADPTQDETDAGGFFEFVGLLSSAVPGDVVYQVKASGVQVEDLAVTVANPVTVVGANTDLGFDKFDLVGKVFVDPAGTVSEPESAAGLGNVQIELYRSSDNAFVAQVLTGSTPGSLGLFEFVNIDPGDYYLRVPSDPVDPIEGNINTTLAGNFELTVTPNEPIALGLGENESPPYDCSGSGFEDRQDGSACGVFFGLRTVSKNIDQKLIDAEEGVGGASLTTKSYTWWKNTLNSACSKGWTVLVDPDVNNPNPPAGYGSDAIYFADIFDAVRGFAFTLNNTDPSVDPDPPFDNQVTGTATQTAACAAYDFIRRPLNSLLLDLEAQLFTAELNRWTPGFGYYPPGCISGQCEDTDFVDTFLQYAEADLIERRNDPAFSAKASYETTESAKLYNGGGGGGGTGFE